MLVNPRRISVLMKGSHAKGPVIDWMSRYQRANDNWALLYAKELAQKQDPPLAVAFCRTSQSSDATSR